MRPMQPRLRNVSTQCSHPLQLNLMFLIEVNALEATFKCCSRENLPLLSNPKKVSGSSVKLGKRKMKPELAAPHSKEVLWNKAVRLSTQLTFRMLSALRLSQWWGGAQQQKYSVYLQLLTCSHTSFCLGLTALLSEKNRYFNTSSMMVKSYFQNNKLKQCH